MATYDVFRPTAGGHQFGGRLSTLLASLTGVFATWNDSRVTRKALGRLTDRELDDIGLVRGDIDRIAGSGPQY